MKYLLLLFSFSPLLAKSQDVAGFFVHDWFYVNKTDLIKNRITTINIVTKGRENWIDQIELNGNARKIFHREIRDEGSFTTQYDSTEIWYYAPPSTLEPTQSYTYSDSILTRTFSNRTIKTRFNKSNQPEEEWLLQESMKATRKFVYNSDNLLDTVFCVIEKDQQTIGKDFYLYQYKSGKLSNIEHYLQLGNDIILDGIITYDYNRAGLIKTYIGKFRDNFALHVSIDYFSGDKRIK